MVIYYFRLKGEISHQPFFIFLHHLQYLNVYSEIQPNVLCNSQLGGKKDHNTGL